MSPIVLLAVRLLNLVLLDVLPPSPSARASVDPMGSHGFAAYIVGGFFALGLLVLITLLLGRRPKSARPQLPTSHE